MKEREGNKEVNEEKTVKEKDKEAFAMKPTKEIHPKVENKYNLLPKDIEKAVILDRKRLQQPPFWRNGVINAWVLSETTAKNGKDREFGIYDEYWIGFYDDNAKAYAGKIRIHCSSFGGMCHYNFSKFYDPKEIDNPMDLEIQEKLLARLNWLIEEGIVEIPGKR